MRHAIASHLLAALLVAGHLPMVMTVYECSMSGSRNLSACCCSRVVGCPDDSPSARPAHNARAAELRAVCCSVNHQRLIASAPTVRASTGEDWREVLLLARELLAVTGGTTCSFEAPQDPAGSAAQRGVFHGPSRGRPLFLVHRALLI